MNLENKVSMEVKNELRKEREEIKRYSTNAETFTLFLPKFCF
jgi:hypothetical protein